MCFNFHNKKGDSFLGDAVMFACTQRGGKEMGKDNNETTTPPSVSGILHCNRKVIKHAKESSFFL